MGFGFRGQITGLLNLEAQQVPGAIKTVSQQEVECLRSGGIWTGTGCAKPSTWSKGDWNYYMACLKLALDNPPPLPPSSPAVTEIEYKNCVKQTEASKGRK